MSANNESQVLGINGLGRIGKLSLWHHAGRKYFNEIVINVGRDVGKSFSDIVHYMERDSTYGRLEAFLNGYMGEPVITDVDEAAGTLMVNGVKVTILREHRNPKDIQWADHDVRLVVDTTGRFLDPNMGAEDPKGAIRGHLEAGAKKVIASAPFKLKQGAAMPEDSVTTVMGINDQDYDPVRHILVFPEGSALLQHSVKKSGFAMIYMGNNCNISE